MSRESGAFYFIAFEHVRCDRKLKVSMELFVVEPQNVDMSYNVTQSCQQFKSICAAIQLELRDKLSYKFRQLATSRIRIGSEERRNVY